MKHLEKPLKEGYQFDILHFIQSGWTLFTKQAGPFIGMTLLFLLIQFTLNLTPYLNLVSNLVSSLLTAGFYIYARGIKRNQEDAKDFFGGFKYIKNVVLYFLTIIAILVPIALLFFTLNTGSLTLFQEVIEASQSTDPDAIKEVPFDSYNFGFSFLISFLILILFGLYLTISYTFVIPLIVDAKLGFWQAMELSRQTVGKRFFTIFFSFILLGILASLAVIITCGVGLLFVIPVMTCIIFETYDQIFEPFPPGGEDGEPLRPGIE